MHIRPRIDRIATHHSLARKPSTILINSRAPIMALRKCKEAIRGSRTKGVIKVIGAAIFKPHKIGDIPDPALLHIVEAATEAEGTSKTYSGLRVVVAVVDDRLTRHQRLPHRPTLLMSNKQLLLPTRMIIRFGPPKICKSRTKVRRRRRRRCLHPVEARKARNLALLSSRKLPLQLQQSQYRTWRMLHEKRTCWKAQGQKGLLRRERRRRPSHEMITEILAMIDVMTAMSENTVKIPTTEIGMATDTKTAVITTHAIEMSESQKESQSGSIVGSDPPSSLWKKR